MNVAITIRVIGVLIGIGLLLSYFTLYNGFLFISKWQLLAVAIGLAELARWGFGFLAAILMWRLHTFAKWSLLIAFVCGFVGSWVSFIPFFGYLMQLADQTSTIQLLMVLQGPNLVLVILVFILYSLLKKSKTGLHSTEPVVTD